MPPNTSPYGSETVELLAQIIDRVRSDNGVRTVVSREKLSSDLARLYRDNSLTGEAAEALRGLIDKVVLTPSKDGYDIELQGDLAGILTLASDTNAKTAGADMAEAVSQISLVAGVGFEPTTFRL